ncbi:MAG: hypothetical protein IKT56_03275 [Clostridia bacterium]|nr:hypothetical protein [Clostridia bacterium]
MAIVLTDDKYYKEIAQLIRTELKCETKYKPSKFVPNLLVALLDARVAGMAEGYEEGKSYGVALGVANGKQEAYDTFWDNFQNYGNRNHYYYAFSYYNFDDNTYNPKYPIKTGTTNTGGQNLFYSSHGITDTKVDIEFEGTANGAFNSARKMKTIKKMIVNENTTFTNTFTYAESLESITFEGKIAKDIDLHWSTKLTRASVESIISHLSSTTSGKTLALSEAAVKKAYETSEGANDGTTSPEWIFLDFPENWTLSLM